MLVTAVVIPYGAAVRAQSRAAQTSLPIGTPITIVCDDAVDARVKPGSQFRAHLRDQLELGGTLVATSGTPARLVVVAKDTTSAGTTYHIAIVGLDLGAAGVLPVHPDTPVVTHITPGMQLSATTLAELALESGKVRVNAPLPFTLSNDPPSPSYTPPPLRTAAPFTPRPRRTRSSPSPTPAPVPSASLTSAPSSAPTSSPSTALTDPPSAAPSPS